MKIALLGMGTVGSGVAKLLLEKGEEYSDLLGQPIELTHVFGRDISNPYNLDLSNVAHVQDIEEIANSDVDLVVELMGGVDFTYQVHRRMIEAGKHVVSANKDMLALHLDELAELANAKGVQIAYEGSAGGGIPVIQPLEHSLQANHITNVMGILNGTTNYILTKMTEENMPYEEALKEAQDLGYAEADPTNDVEGFDAQRKIAILSRLAYRRKIDVNEIPVKGISEVQVEDIDIAHEQDLILKLVGQSQFNGEQVTISVEPMFLPKNHQLAHVRLAQNAIYINGDAIGETMFYGPGAGSLETASAVVSDILTIARFGFVGNVLPSLKADIVSPKSKHNFYIRVNDTASVEAYLQKAGVDFESLGQKAYIVKQMTQDAMKQMGQELEILAQYPIVD